MSLEAGLDPLEEGQLELGGVMLTDFRPVRLDGTEDIPEVEDVEVDSPVDGEYIGGQVLAGRPVTIALEVREGGPEINDETAAATALAQKRLRIILSPLPNRSELRLLRWRHRGEQAKRLWVRPTSKPLSVNGDQKRFLFDSPDVEIRLLAPNPIVVSDELHQATFTAGQTHTIHNDGSMCAVNPTAWSLTAPGPVTLENLDYPDEWIRFPSGPVTVTPDRQVITSGAYGVCYGRSSSLLPGWPLLRPGDNRIRASAACTLRWRDTQ